MTMVFLTVFTFRRRNCYVQNVVLSFNGSRYESVIWKDKLVCTVLISPNSNCVIILFYSSISTSNHTFWSTIND